MNCIEKYLDWKILDRLARRAKMNTTSFFFWDLEPYRSPTSIIIIKGNLVWIVFYNLIDTKKDGRIIMTAGKLNL